jgi:YD repeat-containing protein
MKQFKFIVSSLFILLAASSCKKENTPALVVSSSPRVSKVDIVGSTWSTSYSYNAQGRLSEVKDNSFTSKYDYTSGTPVISIYKNSTGIIDSKISQVTLSSNKISQYTYYAHNDQGQPYNGDNTNFQYDVNGFQVNKTYSGYEYITEVANGNMIKQTVRNSGTVARTFTFEFYTDKLNKFNLNLQEQWYGNYIADNSLFGTKNTNLIKRITIQSATRTEVIDFTYVTNADNYVTEQTTSSSVNGAAPTTYTTKFTYQ